MKCEKIMICDPSVSPLEGRLFLKPPSLSGEGTGEGYPVLLTIFVFH